MDNLKNTDVKSENSDLLGKVEQICMTLSRSIAKRFDNSPVSMRDAFILKHIFECERNGSPVTSSDISRMMNVSRSAVSQIMSSLEKRGYIVGRADKNDKRKTYLHPSNKGKETVTDFNSRFLSDLKNVRRNMGEERFNELLTLAVEAVGLLTNNKES